jgi:ribosomal protein S18 acetylase RimI-like enzyme
VLTIRRATAADASRLADVVTAAYQRYMPRIGRPPAPMTTDYRRLIEEARLAPGEPRMPGSAEVWVACRAHRVVGLLVLRAYLDHLLLENVAVLPEAQGSGVGSRLLRHAEERAAGYGLDEVRLYTNEAMTENLAYYSRRGYVETCRAEEDGFRRVFFAKRLTGS